MSESTQLESHSDHESPSGGLAPLLVLGIHLVGVGATAALLVMFLLPSAHLEVLWNSAWASEEVGRNVLLSSLLHVVVSAVVWFIVASGAQMGYKAMRQKSPAGRATVRARGSVYVETMAVFPVFLLLTFGLIQLTLINLGGALAHVAAYESARTVWLWEPERAQNQVDSQNAMVTVDDEDVRERARIAAALVMTPVAPGDYGAMETGVSDEFEAIREAMTSRFTATPQLVGVTQQLTQLTSDDASLVMSLDSASMPERAFRKFTVSYLGTEVQEVIVQGDRVGVHFEHYQRMAMPFVHALFGSDGPPNALDQGAYYRWDVEYTMPRQRHAANRVVPGS